jgi:hypothetical protein
MKRECVAAEVSVAIEPKMELEDISTSVVGLKFSIEFSAASGTSRHCAATQQFSRFRGEAEMGKPFAEPNL